MDEHVSHMHEIRDHPPKTKFEKWQLTMDLGVDKL